MFMSIGQTLPLTDQAKAMAKNRPDNEALAFSERLVALLEKAGQQRRGAGAYLGRKYGISNVTANDWLNGAFKPSIETARQIAADHGTTFDELYFGTKAASGPPSQPARYSADILSDAMVLLDELDLIQGRRPAPRPDPARLAIACEVIAAGGVDEGQSVVVRLADRFRQQGQGNGNDAGSDSGVGTADGGSAGASAAAKSSRRRA